MSRYVEVWLDLDLDHPKYKQYQSYIDELQPVIVENEDGTDHLHLIIDSNEHPVIAAYLDKYIESDFSNLPSKFKKITGGARHVFAGWEK